VFRLLHFPASCVYNREGPRVSLPRYSRGILLHSTPFYKSGLHLNQRCTNLPKHLGAISEILGPRRVMCNSIMRIHKYSHHFDRAPGIFTPLSPKLSHTGATNSGLGFTLIGVKIVSYQIVTAFCISYNSHNVCPVMCRRNLLPLSSG
jgi:hypothetical protein